MGSKHQKNSEENLDLLSFDSSETHPKLGVFSLKNDFKKLSIARSAWVTGWLLDLYLTEILFLYFCAIVPAVRIAFLETLSICDRIFSSVNYLPPRVKFSIKHDGALTAKLNSRSFAGSKDSNILFRFPAIVISETG